MSTKPTQSPPLSVSLDAFVKEVIPKGRHSVIDPFAPYVAEAILVRKLSHAQVAQWLQLNGVQVTKQAVGKWWRSRREALSGQSPAKLITAAYASKETPQAITATLEMAPPGHVPPPAPVVDGKLVLKPSVRKEQRTQQANPSDSKEAERAEAIKKLQEATREAREKGAANLDGYPIKK